MNIFDPGISSQVRNMDERRKESTSGKADVNGDVVNDCMSIGGITGTLHGCDKSEAFSRLILSSPRV